MIKKRLKDCNTFLQMALEKDGQWKLAKPLSPTTAPLNINRKRWGITLQSAGQNQIPPKYPKIDIVSQKNNRTEIWGVMDFDEVMCLLNDGVKQGLFTEEEEALIKDIETNGFEESDLLKH